jgi:hypothetical protein
MIKYICMYYVNFPFLFYCIFILFILKIINCRSFSLTSGVIFRSPSFLLHKLGVIFIFLNTLLSCTHYDCDMIEM